MTLSGIGLAFIGSMWLLAYIAFGSYEQRWATTFRPLLKWAGSALLAIGLVLLLCGLTVDGFGF